MNSIGTLLTKVITGIAGRLRFPYLFLLTAALFVLDVLIPDLLPLADEIILGLSTLVLASWRKSREPQGKVGNRSTEPGPAVRS